MRFYVDLIAEWIAVAADMIIVVVNVTIYVGIFTYINGMVKDMKIRLLSINADFVGSLRPVERWSIYIQELNLHNEIIK